MNFSNVFGQFLIPSALFLTVTFGVRGAFADADREPSSTVPMAAEGARVAPAASGAEATKYEFQTYFDIGSQWDSAGGSTIGARSFGVKS